jgi:hypothetical protein
LDGNRALVSLPLVDDCLAKGPNDWRFPRRKTEAPRLTNDSVLGNPKPSPDLGRRETLHPQRGYLADHHIVPNDSSIHPFRIDAIDDAKLSGAPYITASDILKITVVAQVPQHIGRDLFDAPNRLRDTRHRGGEHAINGIRP